MTLYIEVLYTDIHNNEYTYFCDYVKHSIFHTQVFLFLCRLYPVKFCRKKSLGKSIYFFFLVINPSLVFFISIIPFFKKLSKNKNKIMLPTWHFEQLKKSYLSANRANKIL